MLRAPIFDFFTAIWVTLLGSLLSWVILRPLIGFDDANITMNFAENLARGEGYIYYIGGERVEGSSSALWTLINTILYLFFDNIEWPLVGLGLLISTFTIYLSIRMTRQILQMNGDQGGSLAWLVGPAFLLFPGYFSYVVWSLMDIGFYILIVMAMLFALMRLLRDEGVSSNSFIFICGAALLGAARPEGIAVAFGLCLLLWISGHIKDQRGQKRTALIGLIAGVAVVGLLTLLRLWYFGQPLPNTYYAKVSTSYLVQLMAGIKYTIRYTYEFANLALLSLSLIAVVVLRRTLDILIMWWVMLACIAGTVAIYAALGGDHFGSFRFYQVLTPLLLPWAVASVVTLFRLLPDPMTGWHRLVATAAFLLLLFSGWAQFERSRGGLDAEFRIAEDGRRMGTILNDFDPPISIGIIAAGGISMTYEGEIFDLLGLNWVDMAQSNRSAVRVKNNSGFSQEVFFNAPPDLILPEVRDCALPPTSFEWVMDEVISSDRFQQIYRYDCYKGLAFYIKKELRVPEA